MLDGPNFQRGQEKCRFSCLGWKLPTCAKKQGSHKHLQVEKAKKIVCIGFANKQTRTRQVCQIGANDFLKEELAFRVRQTWQRDGHVC